MHGFAMKTNLVMWNIPELRHKEQWKEALGLEALAISLQISIYHNTDIYGSINHG